MCVSVYAHEQAEMCLDDFEIYSIEFITSYAGEHGKSEKNMQINRESRLIVLGVRGLSWSTFFIP